MLRSLIQQIESTTGPDPAGQSQKGTKRSDPRVSRGRILFSLFTLLSLASLGSGLWAHHPPTSLPGPGPGQIDRQQNALGLDLEYRKGLQGNRHEWISRLQGTVDLYDQQLAAFASMSYHYYDQYEHKNAGRYGRPRLGLRTGWQTGFWQLTLQTDVAMATGTDRETFIEENYYENATFLRVALRPKAWYLALQVGGIFPLSRLPRPEEPDPYQLPYEPVRETVNRETFKLQKSTSWAGYLGYQPTPDLLVYTRMLYRLPYAGALQERDSSGLAPTIYREAGLGFVWQLTEQLNLQLGYSYPLYRKRQISAGERWLDFYLQRIPADDREYRLYDEAYQLQWNYRL